MLHELSLQASDIDVRIQSLEEELESDLRRKASDRFFCSEDYIDVLRQKVQQDTVLEQIFSKFKEVCICTSVLRTHNNPFHAVFKCRTIYPVEGQHGGSL